MTTELTSDFVDSGADLGAQRMAALAAIDVLATDVDTVLATIADVVTETLPASAGASVILWDALTEAFTTASSTVTGQQPDVALGRVRRSGGATRWIIDNRQPVRVNSIDVDRFGSTSLTSDFGVRAYAGVPIVATGETLGVLYALSDDVTEWTDADIHFLEVVAARAATAIVGARHHRRAVDAKERAEAIAKVSEALIGIDNVADVLETIVDGVARCLTADRVLLLTFDFEEEIVEHHVIGGPDAHALGRDGYEHLMGGLSGWVIRNDKSALSPRGIPDPRETEEVQSRRVETEGGSIIVAPLRMRGRVIGTLTAVRALDSDDFGLDDVLLLETMANQAVAAVDHAFLVELNRASLKEIEAMYKVVETLNREGGVDVLLDGLAAAVADALPADRVGVTLVDIDRRAVTHFAAGGIDGERMTRVDFEELWEGLGGWVLRRNHAAISPPGRDPRESERVQRRREETGAGSILVAPLRQKGRLLGTLTAVNGRGGEVFTQKHVDVVSSMAAQISVGISNALLLEEAKKLAITDDLTGVNNRRHLFDLGEREFRRAVRYDTEMAAIMFDIDRFKSINDTCGHGTGDDVLVGAVRRAESVVRDVDVIGRYGGEEFAVLLPEAGIDEALEIGERIRAAIADRPISTRSGLIEVTVSVGASTMSPNTRTIHELVDHADAAMFIAKRRGRNRVEKN